MACKYNDITSPLPTPEIRNGPDDKIEMSFLEIKAVKHGKQQLDDIDDALAMIENLASIEYEKIRGVTAWYRLTKDHRGSNTQRILGLVGRVFQPPRIQKY